MYSDILINIEFSYDKIIILNRKTYAIYMLYYYNFIYSDIIINIEFSYDKFIILNRKTHAIKSHGKLKIQIK